jgi:D-alanyl-D-alanine carboxypeptidase
MAHSSWGPGWPNCQPGRIDSGFVVSGTRFPGGMRVELVDLAAMLVQECKDRGYRFGSASDPSYGCWGYSCRCISGSSTPSNHSWGLAVDINAPANPYTSPLVTDMPGWMPDLWNAYGFRWGGDYSGSKDAMHYEFMGSVADAASETAKAKAAGIGGGGGTPPGPTDPDPGYEDSEVSNGMALSQQALDQITNLLRAELGVAAIPDRGRALGGILEGTKNVVRDEIGPGAIENPDASLNAGVGARQRLDRAFEFEAVDGYRPNV